VSAAIVTGGAGFIGSNLADALLAQGREVHIVDNLVHGSSAKLPPAPMPAPWSSATTASSCPGLG